MLNFKKRLYKLYHRIIIKLWKDSEKYLASEQTSQLILKNQYKQINKSDIFKYSFGEVGFRKYSQNSEDGILLFIFSMISTTNKIVVEICASDGMECNSANLIINHGWNALLFDGDGENIDKGRRFYKTHADTFSLPPRFVHAWVTRSNINTLISNNNVSGEIDLLSIDIDGVDYWIWDAITCINPRVVVTEVQFVWGCEKSVTVPYSDDFKTKYENGFGIYSGASIKAFVKLAKSKNYRLIGFEKYGFNAFFMRNDIGTDIFPAIGIENYENIPFVKWGKNKYLHLIKDKEWEEV